MGAVEQIEGRLEAGPMRGGPQTHDKESYRGRAQALGQRHQPPDLARVPDRSANKTGVRVHPWTVGRALRRLGLTRKKSGPCGRSSRTRPRSRRSAASGLRRSRASPWNASSSSTSAARTDLVRTHAWSPCGERALGTAPCGTLGTRHHPGGAWAGGIAAAMSIPPGSPGDPDRLGGGRHRRGGVLRLAGAGRCPSRDASGPTRSWSWTTLPPTRPRPCVPFSNGSGFDTAISRATRRIEPDRARLGQGEGPVAQGRDTDRRRPPCRRWPGTGRRHQGRR